MRAFSPLAVCVSVAVGLCSVFAFLFRQQLVDFAANSIIPLVAPPALLFLGASNKSNNNNNNNATTPIATISATLAPTTAAESANTTAMIPRLIRTAFLAVEQAEGAGARVRRSIGVPQLRNFSPFLMLDHFSVSPGAGFPDHPHRGQETITYLLRGGMEHEDFAGHRGVLRPGDLQFMTAGRGIVHAEMPAKPAVDGSAGSGSARRKNEDGGDGDDDGTSVGLQLWVDLPAALKGCEPRYRDLRAEEIPEAAADGGRVRVKVISGESHGVESARDLAYTPVWLLDVEVQPGGRIVQPLPAGWNAFAYTLEGEVLFGKAEEGEDEEGKGGDDAAQRQRRQQQQQQQRQRRVGPYHNVVFEPQGEAVYAAVDEKADKSARFVLVAGTPLDQKVVQYGPFVLTSQEEVYKAFMDYQTYSNGFERARGWQSEIGKRMVY